MREQDKPRILAIDAGGTMTDTFIIDDRGQFVVGKAQTTPQDESEGFMRSAEDALSYWNISVQDAFPSLVTGIYSGTAMVNRLLERKGKKVGVIVTKGMEDYFQLERGEQTYLGYSYSDRLHICTHEHNPPLVTRNLVRGVSERTDVFGDIPIPLREEEARIAVSELLDQGVEAICINFLFSYRNPAHELQMKEIAESIIHERSLGIPVYISADYYPIRGDFPRLNTLVIEAAMAEPSRQQLKRIDERVKELGAKFDLRIMASHGGTISFEARELARTLISGPIGGVMGARWLSNMLGIKNVFCTDIGGTSFDLSMITDGEYDVRPYPDVARTLLAIPLVETDSVGAGTGSYVRINPTSNRVEIGPDSAGYLIGASWPQGGVETVTITDMNVVVGTLNPEYFLGGEIKLDRERATFEVERQIAIPLGLDVYEAASGIIELFCEMLKNEVQARILGKGYTPLNYTLLSYGGGGPLHVGGYTEGLSFEDVIVPSWAAGFSAFGCATCDFEYRYEASIDLPILPGLPAEVKEGLAAMINAALTPLRERIRGEFSKCGFSEQEIKFCAFLRMQYLGQLRDLEVNTYRELIDGAAGLDEAINSFEELYSKVYARAARSPELGYLVTNVILSGSVNVEKPVLPLEEISSDEPGAEALKGERRVYWKGNWVDALIWEMDGLRAGNVIEGLSIIESPSTTFVIPPGRSALLDRNRIFHLS